jgi:hypothetical protein
LPTERATTFKHSYSEFGAQNITIVSVGNEGKLGNPSIVVLLRTHHYQYMIMEVEVGESGDWIGELIEVVDEQLQRVNGDTKKVQYWIAELDGYRIKIWRVSINATWEGSGW